MSWKFDEKIAKVFSSHARSHIPNYDKVIDQCIEVCDSYGKQASIIDVGVATGETITRLNFAGFTSLYGVDNSQAMLDACPQGLATLIHSDSFPKYLQFDVVLMNWTLHFIKNKRAYLQDIYDGLAPGGMLVLSEKVSMSGLAHKFYYDFKRRNGLTEEVIAEKAKSLEGVMHINEIPWYFETLADIGFDNIHIVNAYWCFSTFIGIKPAN